MKQKLTIEGMSCNHCVNHVTMALKEIDGITEVQVDLDNKTAVLDSEKNIDEEVLKSAVDEAGYKVVKVEKL